MAKGVIFDLDLTLVDTIILENARKMRNWHEAYGLIPYTSMYAGIQEVLDKIKVQGIKMAIVSTHHVPMWKESLAITRFQQDSSLATMMPIPSNLIQPLC